jgi:hypothetical protein
MVNQENCSIVYKHIVTNPDQFDMNGWAVRKEVGPDSTMCGTTACIAGWAVELLGSGIDYDHPCAITCYAKSGKHIEDEAAELLGLRPSQVGLFYGSNHGALRQLKRYAEEGE